MMSGNSEGSADSYRFKEKQLQPRTSMTKIRQSRNVNRSENKTALASQTVELMEKTAENNFSGTRKLNLLISNAKLESGIGKEVVASQKTVDCL